MRKKEKRGWNAPSRAENREEKEKRQERRLKKREEERKGQKRRVDLRGYRGPYLLKLAPALPGTACQRKFS